jgi:hypothetical protein
MEREPKRMIDM